MMENEAIMTEMGYRFNGASRQPDNQTCALWRNSSQAGPVFHLSSTVADRMEKVSEV